MAREELMSLERYAEAVAYAGAYPAEDHDTIFGRLSTSRSGFREAAHVWSARIAKELSDGHAGLVLVFARAHNIAQYRARLTQPPPDQISPDPSLSRRARKERPRPTSPTPNRPVAPKDALAAGSAVAIPSYLVPEVSSNREQHSVDPDETMLPRPNAQPVSLPFSRDVGAPTAPTAQAVAPRVETGTEVANPQLVIVYTMSFDDGTVQVVTQQDMEDFPLRRYAALSARLARGEDRAELLRTAGLNERRFTLLASAWASLIRQDRSLREAFADAVANEKK